jgi:chaperone required for assembly of F1-ATPase
MPSKKSKEPRRFIVTLAHGKPTIMCDDTPLLTPAGQPYALPTHALAEAIASEWRGQDEKLDLAAMPFTRMAATSIDLVPAKRAHMVDACLAYSATELLCHRDAATGALAARQNEIWQPYLDWAALTFGALFRVGAGVMPIEQPADVVTGIGQTVAALDAFGLMGLHEAVTTSASLVLGLALALGFKPAPEIFFAAELDAHFQIDAWGADPVTMARLAAVRHDIETIERWFALLRDADQGL